MSRKPVVAALVTALTLLTACSGDEEPPPAPETTEAAPTWNPCDGLDGADLSQRFGTTYAVRTGTPDAPVCTFSPQSDGAPAIDINYQPVVGTLAELIETFGDLEEDGRTQVLSPRVPGADDARVIVDVNGDTLTLSGFVQNGSLVQIVNVLDPKPFKRQALVTDVVAVLGDLAAASGESGLVD